MNIDIAALRSIERERDISFETVLDAIETALLTAYKHSEGSAAHAPDRRRPEHRCGHRLGSRAR